MQKYFDNLMAYPFLVDLAMELREIWEKNGKPEIPSGAGTNAYLPGVLIKDLELMGEGAIEEDMCVYNDMEEAIYDCVGYTYIGSGIWYTQYERGTDEWQKYKEEAEEVINKYRSWYLWEAFCLWRW